MPSSIYNELFQNLKPILSTEELREGDSKQGELGIVGNETAPLIQKYPEL